HLPDHPSVGPGKSYTQAQKKRILDANREHFDGALRSDRSGETLVMPKKHVKGETPPSNEAHIDHKTAKAKGGSNSHKNAQVLSRRENLEKGAD
ncbi:pretoxin, partial [Haliangium sp. UPWRP_2]